GAVYEAYSPNLGFTIASGGRYDNLLKRFGEPLPATGFAISLERLLSVLPTGEDEPLLLLVGDNVESTQTSDTLRNSGLRVLQLTENLPSGEAARYASSVGAGWVCYPTPDGVKLGRGEEDLKLVKIEEVAGMVNG
ncbi:MAG: ATP phosphoribosyltransferase regulatory subunit, partial [Rubrobacteraceae bacterium]